MSVARHRMLLAVVLLALLAARVQAYQDNALSDPADIPFYPLSAVALNLGDADLPAAQWIAAQQAAAGSAPVYTNAKMNSRATFSGKFTPASKTTRLAIFSDDGCDVYVNEKRVHSKLQVGQHLPDLRNSFIVIPFRAVPGETCTIRIEYCNMLYASGWDMDGATLFAFGGGGAFADDGEN